MQDHINLPPDELHERAVEIIRASELSAYADELISRLDFSIDIGTEAARDVDIPIGAHKIGGSPDVAPDFEWPLWNKEPLTFIAQFGLSLLAPLDPKGLLPSQGMLSFFSMLRPLMFEPDDCDMHGIIGMDTETKGSWCVLYTPSAHPLERRASPLENEWAAYPEERVNGLSNSIQLPDGCEISAPDGIWSEDEFYGNIFDAYRNIRRELMPLSSEPYAHQLLGYANYYQDDIREVATCFVDSEPGAMQLLAQFSSDEDLSFAGDGNGYFFINRNDLKLGDFSHTYFGLQR